MISGIGRRFGRTLGRSGGASPGEVAREAGEDVEFAAYAEDCRLFGRIRLRELRLTDELNGREEVELTGVLVESLADAAIHQFAELTVARHELCAVVIAGPRGDPARRLRTRTTRVEVDLGPYHLHGDIHGTPASDPLAALVRRAAWVPLTDVAISYTSGGVEISEDVAALLVNRELARSFRPVEEARMVLPWDQSAAGQLGAAPLPAPPAGKAGQVPSDGEAG